MSRKSENWLVDAIESYEVRTKQYIEYLRGCPYGVSQRTPENDQKHKDWLVGVKGELDAAVLYSEKERLKEQGIE